MLICCRRWSTSAAPATGWRGTMRRTWRCSGSRWRWRPTAAPSSPTCWFVHTLNPLSLPKVVEAACSSAAVPSVGWYRHSVHRQINSLTSAQWKLVEQQAAHRLPEASRCLCCRECHITGDSFHRDWRGARHRACATCVQCHLFRLTQQTAMQVVYKPFMATMLAEIANATAPASASAWITRILDALPKDNLDAGGHL